MESLGTLVRALVDSRLCFECKRRLPRLAAQWDQPPRRRQPEQAVQTVMVEGELRVPLVLHVPR